MLWGGGGGSGFVKIIGGKAGGNGIYHSCQGFGGGGGTRSKVVMSFLSLPERSKNLYVSHTLRYIYTP